MVVDSSNEDTSPSSIKVTSDDSDSARASAEDVGVELDTKVTNATTTVTKANGSDDDKKIGWGGKVNPEQKANILLIVIVC